VVGALVFVGIFVAALYYDMCGNRKSQIPVQVGEDFYAPAPVPATSTERSSSLAVRPAALVVPVAASGSPSSAGSKNEEVESMSSQPSLVMTGGSLAEGDEGASYAYSLEAGNVPSAVAGGGTAAGTATDAASVMTGASTGTFATTTRKFKRTVVAPAGRLGIVIDTTLEGPVVHTVKPDSPLKGALFVGDIIVAIDDVDTKAMSATSITSLMVKTAAQERTLTVLSNDPKR
jgi:hypothetical protein